ncbi:MAG: ATP-binding protein [Candidatus Coproplasma sp.]
MAISSKSEGKKLPLKPKKIYRTNVILWRYFALFTFGIVAVISLVFYGFLSSMGMEGAEKRVQSVSSDIAERITAPDVTEEQLQSIVYEYALTEGVSTFLFDESGNDILNVGHLSEETVQTIYASVNERVPDWKAGKVYDFSTQYNNRVAYNVVICLTFQGQSAKLVARYPVGPVAASVSRVEIILVIIALSAVIIAFFISYTLSKKLSSPLREISSTAKKLASGDYSVQFTSAQYAEIATLSDSLNYMKDEMKKSDDFRKELLANTTHDLKTPLTMIKAYASMIKEISGDDKVKREKHLQVIIDESDRLTGLVNDILNTSKISSGLQDLNIKVFNLTDLIYSVINKFSYLQDTQGYSIMVDVDPNMYTSGDEEKLYQVIYNLVSNAINYTGEDKTVYVSLKYVPKTNHINFSVRDTGKGIGEEELAHIWDRYYRSKDSHTRPVKGTGLGLNIVKIIMENHKFSYGVTSKEGEGSTFYVNFPYVPSTPEQ